MIPKGPLHVSTKFGIDSLKLEGKVTKIQYAIPHSVSAYEVFKNYETALKQAGFEILGELRTKAIRNFLDKTCSFWDLSLKTSENPNDHFYLSAQNPTRDKFVSVYVGGGYKGRPTIAAVGIVEVKSMKLGLITADAMEKAVKTKGHVAIYGIHFAFNKASIQKESEPTIREIAKFLKNNPGLKVYVVGHTDNVGNFKYNMNLSKRRAEAVVRELTEKYRIKRDRLKAFGVGPLAPVASNKTEKGRAKNRRVEIVEQ